jgi:hypothetical protein
MPYLSLNLPLLSLTYLLPSVPTIPSLSLARPFPAASAARAVPAAVCIAAGLVADIFFLVLACLVVVPTIARVGVWAGGGVAAVVGVVCFLAHACGCLGGFFCLGEFG